MKYLLSVPGAFVLSVLLFVHSSPSHPINDQADSLWRAGETDASVALLSDALTRTEVRSDLTKDELRHSLVQLAGFCYESKKFDSVIALSEQIIALPEPVESSSILDLAEGHILRARAKQKMRSLEDAIDGLRTALSLYERLDHPPDISTARVHDFLSDAYRRARQYDQALDHARQAIAISQSLGPELDSVTVQFLHTLAQAYRRQGEYGLAASTYDRAIELAVSPLGKDHPDVASLYNNLGNILNDHGKLESALEAYHEALRIRQLVYGDMSIKAAQSLNNIALIHQNTGQYFAAESGFLKTREILEEELNPNHEYIGGVLINLGAVYLDQRRFADAERVLLKSRSIFEGQSTPKPRPIASVLRNLAIVCRQTGRYAEAESYLSEALDLKSELYGADSPQVAATLNSLGVLEFARLNIVEARTYFSQALEIERAVYGEQHPEVAARLLNLADLSSYDENWVEADSLYHRGAEILSAVYGSENRWVADAWERRATSLYERGDFESAVRLLIPVFDVRLRMFTRNAQILSEPDALAFSTFLQHTSDLLLSIWSDWNSSSPFDTLIARVILSSKGKVTDELLKRNRVITREVDPDVSGLQDHLREIQWQLASTYLAGPEDDGGAYRGLLDSLDRQIETLQAQLAGLSARYRTYLQQSVPTPANVQQVLSEKSVVIEFMRYQHHKTGDYHYAAAMYLPELTRVFDLGSAGSIDSLVNATRRHMLDVAVFGDPTKDELAQYKLLSSQLYDRLLGPIASNVSQARRLVIAPDGPLSLLSFASLQDPAGRYITESAPVTYVTAVRGLIAEDSDGETGTGLLAIGAPDFDAGEVTEINFSPRANTVGLYDLPVSPLEGTRQEVQLIVDSWRASKEEPATLLLDDAASETNFRTMAKTNRVLHIATHGFYIREPDTIDIRLPIEFAYDTRSTDNPLLKSGLFLAGVNRLLQDGQQQFKSDDGVITALEISALPLDRVDIVVLSTCESGAGDIVNGEGVLGLRSAFHMAGADVVVSSLWPVDDQTTAEFMQSLYLDGGGDVSDRLRQQQLNLIKKLRLRGQPDHPYLWAPFIAVTGR